MSDYKPASWLVSAGRPETPGAPMNVPPSTASNFDLGGSRVYTRDSGTPGWEALEQLVGGLEGGEAVAFASGMAAAAAVFEQLETGCLVALPNDCYHGVAELARRGELVGRWRLLRLAVDDTGGWIDAAAHADLLWLESPSNPLLTVADLVGICAAPRKAGGLLAVDNTFATPLNQRPLERGADISMHSATKFIGGHSDLLAGIACTRDPGLLERLRAARAIGGAVPGSLESFLAVRGLRTLAVRLDRAQENAARLAAWLEQHPAVETVRYPGLATDAGHELARAQLDGFGSMISFDLKGGAGAADAACRRVRLIRHATSLGSVESSMERRAAVPGQGHLPPGLLRLSVGIEAADDLEADLAQAIVRG
ncbi:MAG: PLP-dependent transferase [Gammaproteobacteria bacterium]|nr:PLP-dependent transferase [Gammaproteobacteria bacterium]